MRFLKKKRDTDRLQQYKNLSLINRIRLFIHRIKETKSKNLCEQCPDDIRGSCCYYSVHIETPSYMLCEDCPQHIKEKCEYPKEDISERGKKYAIMLPYHCKFLDPETKMCSVFDNRFTRSRICRTIKEGKRTGIWHSKCLYVSKDKEYLSGIVKVRYDDIKDILCTYSKLTYELTRDTPKRLIGIE